MTPPEPQTKSDLDWMQQALALARQAAAAGEVPVGAIVVSDGQVIGVGHNQREAWSDPTAHAELLAIRQAAQQRHTWRLDGCTVYVTLEPCAMCAGAMVLARIGRCVYGTTDPKGGFLGTLGDLSADPRLNHRFAVTAGVDADACAAELKRFFRGLREKGV